MSCRYCSHWAIRLSELSLVAVCGTYLGLTGRETMLSEAGVLYESSPRRDGGDGDALLSEWVEMWI
jgi:hypothetical protein